jgi:hypothetical protein
MVKILGLWVMGARNCSVEYTREEHWIVKKRRKNCQGVKLGNRKISRKAQLY